MHDNILASRYARAFIHIFGGPITLDIVKKFSEIAEFIYNNKKSFFYLKVSAIPDHLKKEFFINLFKKHDAYIDGIGKLIDLLIADKRLMLMADILYELSQLYMKQHSIIDWIISSSDELSPEEKKSLEQFLVQKTAMQIVPTYAIDATLIAGIRLQSDTFLWDYSVKSQLNALTRMYKGYYGN